MKIYNWLFTMYGGRIRFTTPMMWSIGFMVTFIIGGLTGVLVAVPPADFLLHNSLFLVAHFHNVIIGGVLFGAFAGYTYWFPKAFGFRLHEGWGKAAFWFWLIGFYVTFMPLYAVGLLGMTRRMQHYDVAEWPPWLHIASVGAVLILIGIICQIAAARRQHPPSRGAARPDRRSLGRPLAGMGHRLAAAGVQFRRHARRHRRGRLLGDEAARAGRTLKEPDYKPIEMPRNSPTGFVCAFFATVMGFALIWHIWWMVIVGLIGAYATFVVFAWRDHDEYEIPADEVARLDRANRAARRDLVTAAGSL